MLLLRYTAPLHAACRYYFFALLRCYMSCRGRHLADMNRREKRGYCRYSLDADIADYATLLYALTLDYVIGAMIICAFVAITPLLILH